jgi:hypothetical protein
MNISTISASTQVLIAGRLVFACDLDGNYPDIPSATAALEAAGYSVERYPTEYRYRLADDGDDFLAATRAIGGLTIDPDDTDLSKLNSEFGTGSFAARNLRAADFELTAIAERYHGECEEIGFEPIDFEPFGYLEGDNQ